MGSRCCCCGSASSAAASHAYRENLIDINRASEAELQSLPGLGVKRAAAIVSHRAAHGPFPCVAALTQVSGIGDSTLDGIKDLVSCKDDFRPSSSSQAVAPSMVSMQSSLKSGVSVCGGKHEALFFPDTKFPCRSWLQGVECRRKNCSYAHEKTGLSYILALLTSARKSIDVAVFSISQEDLASALLAAHGRGVVVRVITDDEQAKNANSKVAQMRSAAIPVQTDSNQRLHMHHKFAVVDDSLLLNGSFNWSGGAVLGSNENLVISSNSTQLKRFKAEFERLWAAFSVGVPGLAPSTTSFSADVAVMFSPDTDGATVGAIKSELLAAKRSIDVAVFTLTLDDLVNVVLAQHQKGIRVRVITDDQQSKCRGADAQRLLDAGVPLRMDASRFAMHHKFAIIDSSTLINGSFNWTAQAASGNQENVIIYRRAGGLAAQFAAEFERLWTKFAP